MKKFLKNCDFEDYFESHILSRGEDYYIENRILDIWCQDNSITAYVNGSEIYKVELEVDDEEILNSFCSCPYSEDGEYMCKHIAAILYYIKENEIPELEMQNKKPLELKKEESELSRIYKEMECELRRISDRHGFINYYNGRYFVDLMSNVCDYINDFIDNEDYNEAFELIKYAYHFIKDTSMDGSNGEYQESLYLINESASKLLYDDEYFNIFLDYTNEVASNDYLDDFSDSPLHAFILFVHDKDSAKKVIKILDEIELGNGIFVDTILDKISITYDYIDKDSAIKLCYKNINHYGVEELLIGYLKKENRITEVIEILKNAVKNSIRKDKAYEKLLDIYNENHMIKEKKELLPEVIIETSDFKRYKELKMICDDSEWASLKKEIISKIKHNNRSILEDIYMEENYTDKLFGLLKKNPDLRRLAEYQDGVKDKYSKELLNLYKPQILESSKRVSDRISYQSLCYYIGKMKELDNSDDFIFEMLKEMYPTYKSKPAFREEIVHVLNGKNKARFYGLIQK